MNKYLFTGSVFVLLIGLYFFLKKRREARFTLYNLGVHFRDIYGCETALNDFDECMKIIHFYGFLPNDIGYQDIHDLHKAAVASLSRCIDRACKAHYIINDDYKKSKDGTPEKKLYKEAFERSQNNLHRLDAEIDELISRLEPMHRLLTT